LFRALSPRNTPAPVLTAEVQPAPGMVLVSGTLTAAPSTTYTVQVFASPGGTPGQGETFLGSQAVSTDPQGKATFRMTDALPAGAGASFTATATDPANNTSAFSNAVALPSASPASGTAAAPAPTAAQYTQVLVDAFLTAFGLLTSDPASALVGLGNFRSLTRSIPAATAQPLTQAYFLEVYAFLVIAG
jgi:hypothetical protein